MGPPDNPDQEFDIAIVGYGPTGLALAQWLGAKGHKVVAVERWPNLYALPRAGHVDGEIARYFQKIGIGEKIVSESSVIGQTVLRNADGELLAKITAEPSDQGWASHYSLFQPTLEIELDARVRETGNVTVCQGWEVQNIENDGQRVILTAASGDGGDGNWRPTGKTMNVSAKWLIGADGANSIVQQHLGSEVEDLGFASRALVVFAERLDAAAGADMPDSEVNMVLSRPYVAFRESGKRYARWEFHVHAAETDEEISTVEKAWELIEPWGFTPRNARLIRHSLYQFRTLLVKDWRKGNVLLAGDAAHRMPPFQGQGMCGGLRDAEALGWRLDLILRGQADATLLDSYTPERRPHVYQLTEISASRGRDFWLTDAESARKRDAQIARFYAQADNPPIYGEVPCLNDGVLARGETGVAAPAGRLSPQFVASHGGETRRLDDFVGINWSLLLADGELEHALDAGNRSMLGRIGAKVITLGREGSGADYIDVSGDYGRWFEAVGCTALLVRPDAYTFGVASDAPSLNAMLRDLADQLCLRD